jgi:hypothetical protein
MHINTMAYWCHGGIEYIQLKLVLAPQKVGINL